MPSSTHYLLKTNVPEVTKVLSDKVLEQIRLMKRTLNDLETAVKSRGPRDTVAYAWIENIDSHYESIKGNVSRINGAVLVTGTE
jgi:hypothetical protein